MSSDFSLNKERAGVNQRYSELLVSWDAWRFVVIFWGEGLFSGKSEEGIGQFLATPPV